MAIKSKMWSACPLKYIRQFINKALYFLDVCGIVQPVALKESDLEEKKCSCKQPLKCSGNRQTGQALLLIISAVGEPC